MTKPQLKILISDTHNPWFNLATEEWIFNELEGETQILFLWRNHDTVVIGRNQNPWSECNLSRMEDDRVTLARRTSGGGAVFHDLGNTCFTFLSPRLGYDRAQNTTILLGALKRVGIEAEASGRNDLMIHRARPGETPFEDGPRKISGSAFRENQKRAFHHGTFLISTDLTRLANYLTPHPKKLASKGRASVRSRVMNLQDANPQVTHESLAEALILEFQEFHGGVAEIEHLDHARLKSIPALGEIFDKFASWDWRFGHAPQFKQVMVEYLSGGLFEIHLDSEQGRISRLKIFSDSLHQELIPKLESKLTGCALSRAGFETAFTDLRVAFPELQNELAELQSWLNREVEV